MLMQIIPSTTGQAAHASYPPDAASLVRRAIGARLAEPVVVMPTHRVVSTTVWGLLEISVAGRHVLTLSGRRISPPWPN
jgi:hypothetical protein